MKHSQRSAFEFLVINASAIKSGNTVAIYRGIEDKCAARGLESSGKMIKIQLRSKYSRRNLRIATSN